MRALPWRQPGRPTGEGNAADGPATTGIVAGVRALEPWLAPVCALILLLAPNPLLWPAAILGLVPTATRLITTGRPWRATPFDLPLLLLAIGSVLGGWASLNAEGAIISLAALLAGVLLFAAGREHLSSQRALSLLVPGLLVAAVISSLALLVLVGPFLLLDHVPPVAAAVAAVDRWGAGAWFVDQDWLLQRYRFRASGVGALGLMGLALVIATFVGRGDWRSRALTLLTVPLFLTLLVVADNRGAMLASAMTVGAMATVWRRRLLPLVPIAGLLVILFLAFGPVDRGLSLKTLAQRFWFWENSLYLAREVPLTGAGLGLESVQLVYRAYFLPAYPPFSHAHNIYLQGLLEFGIFGLLGLAGLALATLYVGWTAPAAPTRWTMAGRLAGFGIATALFTTGLSEIVMLTTLGYATALGALGLLAATSVRQRHASASIGAAADSPGRSLRGGAFTRRRALITAAIGTAAAVVVLVATPLGNWVAARALLNAGTADLNRATLSETIDKGGREEAVQRAVRTLRRAAEYDAQNATIQRNLALALEIVNESRPARAAADQATALISPDDRADIFQLGRMYEATNNWSDAIRSFEAAGAAPQLLQVGNRLLRIRNYDQAYNAFVATARVDPTSRGAYDGATRAVRERKGDTDEMIEGLQPLMEPGSKTEFGARLQASRVYREAGRLREAGEQLKRAEQIMGGPDLSFERGRVMLAAGRADQAEALLQLPVKDQPYDSENWLWLARAQAQIGLHEQAVSTIREGLSKVDPSGQFAPPAEKLPETAAVRAVEIKRSERAPMLGVMAESLIRVGRTDEAMPALEEATSAAPRDRWLEAVQREAQEAADGQPVNLVLNGTFDREGAWATRTEAWWERPSGDSLLDDMPTFSDGAGRLELPATQGRSMVQEVLGLEPEQRYRLSARVRSERLGGGTIRVALASPHSTREVVRLVQEPESERGVTVQLEAATGDGSDRSLTVVFGFGPDTPPGAVLVVDDVTLVPADGARATTPARSGG